MSTPDALSKLTSAVQRLADIDVDKLLRKGLGEESIAESFGSRLEQIKKLGNFAEKYAAEVHNEQVAQAASGFERLANLMTEQAVRPSAEYIGQRDAFLQGVDTLLEESKRWRPAFTAAAVLQRGFLEDEGIREESARALESFRDATSTALATVKDEADKAVQGAKKLADEIEERARRTASKISVEEAQNQFSEAVDKLVS